MKFKKLSQIAVACITCFAVTSCSLFVSGKQSIRIETNDPNCIIKADGLTVGHGYSAVASLKKNKSHVISAENGTRKGMTVVDSELSTTGVLDLIGGICFLVPFLGFCSKGAWTLDPDIVAIDVR